MENITIKLPAGSPASRRSAIPYRDRIIEAFDNPKIEKIILDLNGVEIISGSFADECVGILVEIYGLQRVKDKIRLSNGNGAADKSIVKAILDRQKLSESIN